MALHQRRGTVFILLLPQSPRNQNIDREGLITSSSDLYNIFNMGFQSFSLLSIIQNVSVLSFATRGFSPGHPLPVVLVVFVTCLLRLPPGVAITPPWLISLIAPTSSASSPLFVSCNSQQISSFRTLLNVCHPRTIEPPSPVSKYLYFSTLRTVGGETSRTTRTNRNGGRQTGAETYAGSGSDDSVSSAY